VIRKPSDWIEATPAYPLFHNLSRPIQWYLLFLVAAYILCARALPPGRPEVVVALIAIFAGAAVVQPVPRYVEGIMVPNVPLVLIAALLWTPQEVLLGAGIGTLLGLALLRKSEIWHATLNGALSSLPAAAAAAVVGPVVPRGTVGEAALPLIAAALIAIAVVVMVHSVLSVWYLSLQSRRPFLHDWLHHLVRNPANQLIATPLAVVLAAASASVSGEAVGVVLTAACALALPLARQELAYYHQSQEMLEEIVEAIVRVLDRVMPGAREHSERVSSIAVETGRRLGLSEQSLVTLRLAARLHDVGILTESNVTGEAGPRVNPGNTLIAKIPNRMIAAVIQAHHQRWVDREGHRPHRRTLVSLAGSILAAAELYDSARSGISPFGRPVSQEAVERELRTLAGSTLDPEVVPIILRVGHELSPQLVGVS